MYNSLGMYKKIVKFFIVSFPSSTKCFLDIGHTGLIVLSLPLCFICSLHCKPDTVPVQWAIVGHMQAVSFWATWGQYNLYYRADFFFFLISSKPLAERFWMTGATDSCCLNGRFHASHSFSESFSIFILLQYWQIFEFTAIFKFLILTT